MIYVNLSDALKVQILNKFTELFSISSDIIVDKWPAVQTNGYLCKKADPKTKKAENYLGVEFFEGAFTRVHVYETNIEFDVFAGDENATDSLGKLTGLLFGQNNNQKNLQILMLLLMMAKTDYKQRKKL